MEHVQLAVGSKKVNFNPKRDMILFLHSYDHFPPSAPAHKMRRANNISGKHS